MKFYLDNILLQNEPNGDITTTIKRDAELGGYLITNDAKLNFWGDGYAYIQSRLEATGYCGEINIKINDECNGVPINIFIGKIFLLEITKDNNCIITTPLQDNNYYARISKNKSIKTFIDSTRSKNAATIAAAKLNHMTMFDPATGNNLSVTRQGWRVYDVFTNLTAFLSDGEMTFGSDYLGIGGEFEGLSITTGQEIFYQGTGKAPQVTFSDFYTEVNKKLHTVIFINLTGTIPEMRIESDASAYTTNIIKKLEAVGEVTFKVDSSKLIAKVNVGSSQIMPGVINLSFVDGNDYFTYKTEEYTTLGQCNIDSTLDLVSKYIISSNVIEDCLMFPNNNFSEDIFFIDCENVAASGVNYTSNAIESSPFTSTPPVFYNRRLMNDKVLERWNNIFPNSIVSFSGTVNNQFRAFNSIGIASTSGATYTPFQFNNDFAFPSFDGVAGTNNYGNGTAQGTSVSAANSRFTCPEDGNYSFFVSLRALYTGGLFTNSGLLWLSIVRKDSGGATLFQDSTSFAFPNSLSSVFQNVTHFSTMICNATDYVEIYVIISASNTLIGILGDINNTIFTCTSAPNSTGVISVNNNQLTIPLIKADFEYPIKNADFYDIQNNLFDKIAITFNIKDNAQVKEGWIDNIKYNHNTSQAKITLRSTQTLIQ